MIKAYVLGKVVPASEKRVRDTVKKINGVTSVDITFGQYDLVVSVEASDEVELQNIVLTKIRKNPDITKTLTLIAQKI